jgi:hypothetical protein
LNVEDRAKAIEANQQKQRDRQENREMIEERAQEFKQHALYSRLLKFSKEKQAIDLERRAENPYAAQT